jgi:acyl carrier protein
VLGGLQQELLPGRRLSHILPREKAGRFLVKRSELREIVAEVLEIKPNELNPDTDLTTIETFDSVSVLTLMVELAEQAGIRMGPTDTRDLRYYRDIERLAEKQNVELTD